MDLSNTDVQAPPDVTKGITVLIADREPATENEWVAWIADRIKETDTAYLAKPEFMVGHYRGEKSTASDYADRELLELVQNAADAAMEGGCLGRVRIEVTEHGLFVANTGRPFRTGGVRSLMTAHTSDKPEQDAPLIGAKGLGFRSLLNWSSEPYISSGDLTIGFSRGAAEQHAKRISSSSPAMQKILSRRGELEVPVLAFPVVGDALQTIDDLKMISLMDRAADLRANGYDTVVAAAFSSAVARERALTQLKEFQPQFLLFVPAISELVLHAEGYNARWSKKPTIDEGLDLEILVNGKSTAEAWICRSQKGAIIADTGGEQEIRSYEVAVAIRRDQSSSSGALHCYFPTEVPLPFPALFHATLDLDSHRKTVRSASTANQEVLKRLAELYVKCLVDLTKAKLLQDPIAFLTRTAQFPPNLREFEETVYRAAGTQPLIANTRGKRVTASATQLGPLRHNEYLPRRLFGSLARCRSDQERSTLGRLGVQKVDVSEVLARLRGADLTIAERAAVVVGFARHLDKEFHDRSLLIDPTGRRLSKTNSCFPPPSNAKPPTLPRWARAKILHPELWTAIVAGLGGQPRERFRLLERFGVNEFSSEGVITSLRGQAQRTLKNNADHDKINRELLGTLFQLRRTISKGASYPQGRTEVLCQDGKWRDAHNVHLSSGYGQSGKILASLYQAQPNRLLAAPTSMGLDTDPRELEEFFRWIGVHRWPAAVERSLPSNLQGQIKDQLPDEFDVTEGTHRNRLKKSDVRWASTLKAEQLWLVDLEAILSNAPSGAILAWLAQDPRFDPHSGSHFWTKVYARPSARANFKAYSGIPSDLVREAILSTPWLETVNGQKVGPRDAMMAPGGLAKLFHTPRRPTADEANIFGLDRLLWARGLLHAGVPGELSDLSEVQIYRLLVDLKRRETAPDLVRRLYLQVLDLDAFDADNAGDAGESFRREGQIQVRTGGNLSWVTPAEALYLDRDNFPTAAREYFALIDLPPRRSATEVNVRFGVQPVSKQRFSLTVSKVVLEETVISASLRARLAECLPFIKAYRSAHSVDMQKLRQLEKLTLQVANEVQIEVSLGSQIFPGALGSGQYVLNGECLIVAVDPVRAPEEVMFTAITAMSDGLAEFFELQSGDDFEKLLSAETKNLRMLQLRRLLSNQPDEEIDRLLASIDELDDSMNEDGSLDAAIFALGSGAGENKEHPGTSKHPNERNNGAPKDAIDRASLLIDLTEGVEATKLEVPNRPHHARKVNIRIAGGSGGSTGGQQGPQDRSAPTDAEQWAMLFEEGEGRYPIRVSRLQGQDAFGCDCLSFLTEGDREAFRIDPKQLRLVDRFIEVKSGSVRLTENEMIAAEKHKKRYHIYRVQFDALSRTSAHLTIVTHPLSHRSALARECEIIVDKITNRLRYRLNPKSTEALGSVGHG